MQPSPNSPFAHLDPARRAIAEQKMREAYARVLKTREAAVRQLAELQLEIDRRTCSTLKGFTQHFWDILEPTEKLVWNWHLDELCDIAERVIEGEEGYFKVIINVPPGTMKSLLMSVMLRAYIWSKFPDKRFLSASYSGPRSTADNVKLRTLIQSERFQRLFPAVVFRGDQNAKERFETTAGGYSLATSVGGVGTGEHPDFTFIDDPISEKQSRSKLERDEANTWIDRTLSSRGVTRNMRTIVIMQRLHEEDPTGHLLAKGGWTHIKFEMRYVGRVERPDGKVELPDPRDHRTEKGQLLWPELFPEHKVRNLEIALGPYGTAGQLQQRPSPEGGGLFKREYFKYVAAAPKHARRVRCWDTAATEDGGDYTATCRISEPVSDIRDEDGNLQGAGRFYIEHAAHAQLAPSGVERWMVDLAKYDGKEVSIRELQEPASAGKTVIAARTRLLKGWDHKGVLISNDKVTMAKPFRAQCEAGNVYIVQTGDPAADEWIEPFLDELTTFPTGKNDDLVDAASNGFNQVLLEPLPEAEWVTW